MDKSKKGTMFGNLVGGFLAISIGSIVLSETAKSLDRKEMLVYDEAGVIPIEQEIKEKGIGKVFAERLQEQKI